MFSIVVFTNSNSYTHFLISLNFLLTAGASGRNWAIPILSWYFWLVHLLTLNQLTLCLPVLHHTSVFRHWSCSLATLMFALVWVCFMCAQSHVRKWERLVVWKYRAALLMYIHKPSVTQMCSDGLCVCVRVSDTVGYWAILWEDPSLVSIKSHQLTPLAAVTVVYPALCRSQRTIRGNISQLSSSIYLSS